jgi:hypothetical protein
MHENARRSDRRRDGGKTRRVAKTNAKVRRLVRRKDRKVSKHRLDKELSSK